MTMTKKVVSIKQIVGGGYGKFWNWEGRYLVVKGSRGSKKSKTTALKLATKLNKYPLSNALVLRNTAATLRDSCYVDLLWAFKQLGPEISNLWVGTVSPLRITNKKTGQVVLFRGLDDPLKLTSMTVEVGFLNFAWLEEAYELLDEEAFNKVDESLRGRLPKGYYYQFILSFNPWNQYHWLKSRFFDNPDDQTLAMTTNYLCNEFIDDGFINLMEKMRERNPARYRVAGLGEWGVAEGLVFERWEVAYIDTESDYFKKLPKYYGMDFGYVNDPSTLPETAIDEEQGIIYIFGELYKQGMLNTDIAEYIKRRKLENTVIIADSAEQKSIAELNRLGCRKVEPARKGPIIHGIQFLQNYRFIIHQDCKHTIAEFASYSFTEDKFGKLTNKPVDKNNHVIDALRYAYEYFYKPENKAEKTKQSIRKGLF
ncbi:MAG: PBSX family phage terminase large subunit [Culicoidibacterales bacterium]